MLAGRRFGNRHIQPFRHCSTPKKLNPSTDFTSKRSMTNSFAIAGPSSSPLPTTIVIGVLGEHSSSTPSPPLPTSIYLTPALQGAFVEHIEYLSSLRPVGHTISAIPIRTSTELQVRRSSAPPPGSLLQHLTSEASYKGGALTSQTCHALVIPGGESTVIESVAARTPGLLEALKGFVRDPERAVWGTCAGTFYRFADLLFCLAAG